MLKRGELQSRSSTLNREYINVSVLEMRTIKIRTCIGNQVTRLFLI